MKHRRSPTLSYPHNIVPPTATPGHPALALRYPHTPIPTLFPPLRLISNTPFLDGGDDNIDDFQSNAWISTPSHRVPLAGLGITYLRDASTMLDHGILMQVDGDQTPFVPDDIRSPNDFPHSIEPYRGYSDENPVRIVSSLYDAPTGRMDLDLNGSVDPIASDIVGLIPDVNMYDRLRRLDVAHPGVNPLDTICSVSPHNLGIPYAEPPSLTPEDQHLDDALFATDPKVEQSPSPRVIQDIMSILIQPAPELLFLPSPACSPSIQGLSPSPAPRGSVRSKLEQTHVPETGHCSLSAPEILEYAEVAYSSPVLNAHLGIKLDELISRAECFRIKYPDQDIDRAWLSHFAGKLSDRGELLNDFRCYVIGCDQRNKRRDHILVHVGAHIGQRPFACSICPLRFLRKNECKRHEASHSGFRPYSCDICGQTFVRQDLVKRHVKRTHGARDENQPSVAKQSRKKTRLR